MVEVRSVLIVANSARMLAQQASGLGFLVWVIDCYADFDTQKFSNKCIKVDSLAVDQVRKAIDKLTDNFEMTHVVYGSGLEPFQDTLAFLDMRFFLLGNKPDVFLAVQNNVGFFSKLTELTIPHPETTFQPPASEGNWLIKPLLGQGGVGIERYSKIEDKFKSQLWQRYIEGISMSVLFVANGADYQIIGFNKLVSSKVGKNEFIFSAVMNQPAICKHIRKAVTSWLVSLVKYFSLNGMNSLDFIVSDGECYLLEINPRPSASMQLYSDVFLKAHINSCLPAKSEIIQPSTVYSGYKIIFATTEYKIKDKINWPEWAADIPYVGSKIHIDMPICSIIAHGINELQVEKSLQTREKIISKLLR